MLQLTSFKENHYNDFVRYVCSSQVAKYLTRDVYQSDHQARIFFENAKTKNTFPNEFLAILLNGKLIWTVHMISRWENITQIWWGIMPEYRYKWYGAKSFNLMIKYVTKSQRGKNTLTLWADSHVDNVFAIRIIKTYGFVEWEEIMYNRRRYIYMLK